MLIYAIKRSAYLFFPSSTHFKESAEVAPPDLTDISKRNILDRIQRTRS